MLPKEYWIDAQLPPKLALYLSDNFSVNAKSLSDIGLRDASDQEIFASAKNLNAAVITKDSDFVDLLIKLKSPPKIILLTFGNTSNKELQIIFSKHFPEILSLIEKEGLIEISG